MRQSTQAKGLHGRHRKQDQAEKQETDLQTSSSASTLFSTATWFDFGEPGKKDKKAMKRERKKKEKAEELKAGADVGKIVNLMAGDANKVRLSFSILYHANGKPGRADGDYDVFALRRHVSI
jgi:hypothetical protein